MKCLTPFTFALYCLLAIASAAAQSIPSSYSWTSTGPIMSAKSDSTHNEVSIKDPSAVYYNGQWIVYASDANSQGNYNMEYRHFTDWSQASAAQPYYMDNTPGFSGYHTAPQVFYFAPQNKWYLIFQSGQPQFSTNSDPTKPQNWTSPQNFFATQPSNAPTWLDFWVICDSSNCFLFFTGDNGKFYRSSTSVGNFPYGFNQPVVVYSESNTNNLFEADNVYTVEGTGQYLALIECIGGSSGNRFFRALVSNSLGGNWTPLGNTLNFSTPFLGSANVSFQSGVSAWTHDFSSGGLLIDGYDQTDSVNPNNLQFLYQGVKPNVGGSYNLLPWQLGLATSNANKSSTTLIANGTYFITAKNSGLVLDDYNLSTTEGTKIDQWPLNSQTQQKWKLTNLGNNYVELINEFSGYALEVYNFSTANGGIIDQWPYSGGKNQIWQIVSKGGGEYQLTNENSGLALDVTGASTAEGTFLQQYGANGQTNQQFSFTATQ